MTTSDHDSAWIAVVPDDEWSATEGLRDHFDAVVDRDHGRVDHIMAIHSLNPRGLAAHNALFNSAMAGTASLRKVERELLALIVSLENRCHY